MADELSLLWKLRADNTQAKTVMADTRSAVASLQRSFGPELAQSVSVANKAFTDIGNNLTSFVGQRIPLVGPAFITVTNSLHGLNDELKKGGPSTANLARQIDGLAKSSGKSREEVTRFLAQFTRLGDQTSRNEAAFKVFGGAVDLVGNKTAKFLPELEAAGAELSAVATESTAAAASIAAMAGPIAIGVAAMVASVLAVGALTKALFDLAKASAEYQGKLFDLSQQTGVSVETLSALEVVARTTGGSIETLTQSLGIFQKNLEAASEDADSKAGQAFKRLGVDATDTEQALRQTIAALARMPEGFRQTAAALEVFGRGGKAFLAIAKESKGDIDEITRKLKDLGLVTTDQAKLADEFNDQLVLLEVQLRGIGTEAIPVFLDLLKDVSTDLKQNREAFNLTGFAIKLVAAEIVGPLRTAFAFLNNQLIVNNAALESFLRLVGLARNASASIPSGTPTPTTPEPTKDPFTKSLEEEVAARKRLQGVLSFDLEERKRNAQASIAQAQREFEAGKRSREDLLKTTIAGIKAQLNAEIEGLKVDRKIKLEEQALAKDDLNKRTQLGNAILQIDTQIAAKRFEIKQRELDERAKFRQEEQASETAHQERLLARSRELDAVNIRRIEQRASPGLQAALDADKEIENIELTAIDREQSVLVQRLELAGKDEAKHKELTDQIAALDVRRTATTQRHAEQRLAIVKHEGEIALQLIQVTGESLIATAGALAEARIITEEEAERRIAKTRLDLIDAEIEAAKTSGADIRVLNKQREVQQAENERNIEAGRQRDLENERRYANELTRIKERIRDVERTAAREVIELMRIHFASRKDIARARTQLEVDDENARHKQAEETITALEREIRESRRTAQEKLEAEQEINRLREAEAKRHRITMQGITDAGRHDEQEADPFGRFNLDTDSLKEFASVIENSIVPLGDLLTHTFLQVADAIGQTVANWVLMGETGPAVMRKILAQALASLAAEAAVQSLKELALGFATLFFNPAESAAHFTAAGIWASIGGVAAVAGRGVAGDLFKQQTRSSDTGTSGANNQGQIDPLRLERNAGDGKLHVVMEVQPTEAFVVNAYVKDYQLGGRSREVTINDGASVG